jgi:hypothetical protein
VLDTFWRSLTLNFAGEVKDEVIYWCRPGQKQKLDALKYLSSLCALAAIDISPALSTLGVTADELEQVDHSKTRWFGRSLTDTKQRAMWTWMHTKPFITENGHFGLGSDQIHTGDHIAVLHGGYFLFALRPGGDGYRLMDGNCYVHAYMDGQGVNDETASDILLI